MALVLSVSSGYAALTRPTKLDNSASIVGHAAMDGFETAVARLHASINPQAKTTTAPFGAPWLFADGAQTRRLFDKPAWQLIRGALCAGAAGPHPNPPPEGEGAKPGPRGLGETG